MALMNLQYDETYFAGDQVAGYSNYGEPNYRDTDTAASKLIAKAKTYNWDLTNAKVLVVGCAYGYLVKHLVLLGVDAYGMDISSYAISQAPSEVTSRVFVGDARLDASFAQAKTLAGLTKTNDKFDLILEEDMILCLTDAEAVRMSGHMNSYSNMVYHVIDPGSQLSQWYNWKTIAGWKALIGTNPNEKWFRRFDWTEE